jgi:hypothetical protein
VGLVVQRGGPGVAGCVGEPRALVGRPAGTARRHRARTPWDEAQQLMVDVAIEVDVLAGRSAPGKDPVG